MKKGLTLSELELALAQQEEAKQDYLVDSSHLQMESGGFPPVLRVLDEAGEDCVEPLALNATAHRQLGAYLRIPANYYPRMLKEDPDLLASNVNRCLHDVQEPKLLRTMDGTVRALLSNRYWCVDHLELLQAMEPVFDQIEGLAVRSCGLTEARMYVEVINQRLQQDVVPGDTVQYGIIITNSEVGMGAITIKPLIYRLVCTNGMVVSKQLGGGAHRIHKGSALPLSGTMRSYEAPGLSGRQQMVTSIRQSLTEAIRGAKFEIVLEQMRRATKAAIEAEDLTAFMKEVGPAVGLREAEQSPVLQHLLAERDMTQYGLANAVTRYAQDVDSYDRATELETLGYDLMTMPQRQWTHFNEMAAALAAA